MTKSGGSRQIRVTLSGIDGDKLYRWADSREEKPATLAQYLLKQAIDAAEADGKIPPEIVRRRTGIVDSDEHEALLTFISKLADGSADTKDVATIAHITGIDVDELQSRVDKSKNGND